MKDYIFKNLETNLCDIGKTEKKAIINNEAKDILYKLEKVEYKIESERRFFADNMRPLKQEQMRLVRELKKFQ